ncbi:MAG: alpha/beta hydrolase [Microthrixaceae bacterium]|nr:alpha/beta hydrolase [Microthrixaceae bacterium]
MTSRASTGRDDPTRVAPETEARPQWLTRSLGIEPQRRSIEVGGCDINLLVWGEPDRPGLVLVHGGAAHAHWWSAIAPLIGDYRVVALDLSGHGDSGRRETYRVELWTQEVLAAAEAVGAAGPPVVIGHSMGGFVAVATAVAGGDRVAGIIVLDSPMVEEDPEVEAARIGAAFGVPRTYPTLDEAVARFRTVPAQDNYDPWILDHVARHSLRRTEDGWAWKFDPGLFRAVSRNPAAEQLPNIRCRVALLRSEFGLVTPEIGRIIYENLGRVAPVVEVPLAGHHMMLDQPLLLLTALRALLADWEHSVPSQR